MFWGLAIFTSEKLKDAPKSGAKALPQTSLEKELTALPRLSQLEFGSSVHGPLCFAMESRGRGTLKGRILVIVGGQIERHAESTVLPRSRSQVSRIYGRIRRTHYGRARPPLFTRRRRRRRRRPPVHFMRLSVPGVARPTPRPAIVRWSQLVNQHTAPLVLARHSTVRYSTVQPCTVQFVDSTQLNSHRRIVVSRAR